MRFLVPALSAGLLLGCAAAPQEDVATACTAQGFAPGTEEFRVCMDARGATIATGPGSPYANADEEDDSGENN